METPEGLIDRFTILPVTEETNALCEELFELEGDALRDALTTLVMKHPSVVGAMYLDPGGPYWDEDAQADEIQQHGRNPTRREHAQEAYEGWAKAHGKPCPAWPDEALELIDAFALRGINRESEGLYDRLLTRSGEDLRDTLAWTVKRYPGMVGAGHEDPDAPSYDPDHQRGWTSVSEAVKHAAAVERKGYNPTKRQHAQEAYEQWSMGEAEHAANQAEVWSRRAEIYRHAPNWAAAELDRQRAEAAEPQERAAEATSARDEPVSSHRCGRSR